VAQGLIPDWLDAIFLRSLVPAIRRLVTAQVNPNWLTVLAFLFTLVAAVLVVADRLLLAFACLVVGGILDFTDGKVAVLTGRVTRSGAVLDSVLDRYSDAVVYLALMIYFAVRSHPITALAAVVALIGSMMTSYTMALGKSLGIDFRIGVLRRQDRVTLISVGLVFTPLHDVMAAALQGSAAGLGVSIDTVPIMPLAAIVYLLAMLSNVTALQRLRLLFVRADRAREAPESESEQAMSLREKQLSLLEREIGIRNG
jgi:CDP-diacylglycerol--glycerol-3-phosphate 3-phosphatidyltransferase